MRKVLNICQYVLLAVLTIILIFGGYNLIAKLIFKNPQPKIFGYSNAVVLSGSMEPEFSVNDMLIYKKQKEYKIGDIICFNDNGYLTTHRIVEIQEDGSYITKGDANNSNDVNPVSVKDVHGKVIREISGVGAVLAFLQSPVGLVIIVITAFCVMEVPRIIKSSKQNSSKQKE